jgi:hypothetical protein
MKTYDLNCEFFCMKLYEIKTFGTYESARLHKIIWIEQLIGCESFEKMSMKKCEKVWKMM